MLDLIKLANEGSYLLSILPEDLSQMDLLTFKVKFTVVQSGESNIQVQFDYQVQP